MLSRRKGPQTLRSVGTLVITKNQGNDQFMLATNAQSISTINRTLLLLVVSNAIDEQIRDMR